MAEDEDAEGIEELREIVRRRGVVYAVHPHRDVYRYRGEERIVEDGYDLELYGTHDHGHTSLTPGCEQCIATYNDLRRIAEWLLPDEPGPSSYHIPPFDASLHRFRGASGEAVELTVSILHRRNWPQPIDAAEQERLRTMEEKLRRLGVRRV